MKKGVHGFEWKQGEKYERIWSEESELRNDVMTL